MRTKSVPVWVSECVPVSFCVSQWASPGCTVDKKGQREARGYPLLTGCLWRAEDAAPESGLMVEMDAQSPCGVIPFMASVHLWYMERRQMPARAITDVIGEILLGDVEAECSFELMPQSRVMLGVIECCCAPTGEEKDENLFSASLLEELYNFYKFYHRQCLKKKH